MAKDWPPEQVRIFKANTHKPIAELERMFPDRTRKAIVNLRFRLVNGIRDVENRRGISRRKPKPVRIPAHIRASEKLRIATLKAIVNYANDNGLGVDDAARRLLSHAC